MDGWFPAPVVASLVAAPDRPALEVGSRTVTRGELLAMVRRIVTGLREAGLGPGSGVGMVLSLSPEAYAAHLAAHALGCRVAAARPVWSPDQLAHALDRGRFDAVVADVPVDRPVLPLGELLARPDPGGTVPTLARPDDVARLTYTSGSTGRPKACAHSYRAISLAYQPGRWAPALATAHLEQVLDEVPHGLPTLLDRRERAFYLQGTFFNTAVVQSSEATAHLLMVLAADESLQRAAREDGALDGIFEETLRRFPLFGVAHRITTDAMTLPTGSVIPSGSVLCFNYPEFHRSGGHIPFGVAANRPCPAWHLAPTTVKAVTRELLDRFAFATAAAHTRPIANRGPCLMSPRTARVRLRGPALVFLRVRDRWEDVGRSLTQLVLGTYMVWHARRLRLCERYFERTDAAPASGLDRGGASRASTVTLPGSTRERP